MKVQKFIEVRLLKKRTIPVIDVVQYDTGIQLVFSLVDFDIPDGTTAILYVQKRSGKFVYQEENITIDGNEITIDLENQALTEYGETKYQIMLSNGDDTITTFAGVLRIEKSLADANAVESKTVIRAFEEAADEEIERILNAYDLLAAKAETANAIQGYLTGTSVSADDVSPWEHEVSVHVHGVNMIPLPYYHGNSITQQGVEITVDEDGVITFNGTALADSAFRLINKASIRVKGKYTLSGCDGGSNTTYYMQPFIDGKGVSTLRNGSLTYIWDGYLTSLAYFFKAGTVFENVQFAPQLEVGTTATDHEAWLDPATVTVTADGVDYVPASDGTVEGIPSSALADGITTDNSAVIVECEYNRDTNKVIEKLTNAIIALGGTV